MQEVYSMLEDAYTITPSTTLDDRYYMSDDSLIRLNINSYQFGTLNKRFKKHLSYDYTEIIKNQNFKNEYSIDTRLFVKGFLKNFGLEFVIKELRETEHANRYFNAVNNKDADLEDKLAELFNYITFIDEVIYAKDIDENFDIKQYEKSSVNFILYDSIAALSFLLPTELPPLLKTIDLFNKNSELRFFTMTQYDIVQQIREKNKRINAAAKKEYEKLSRANLSGNNV